MNAEHIQLEKVLKKAQIWNNTLAVIFALVTALGVGYGFYYNTKSTLNSHTDQIQNLQTDINEVKTEMNDAAVFQGVSATQIKALEDKVNAIDVKMDRMDDKLDQILIKK
jgi:uncharacterized protein HemX